MTTAGNALTRQAVSGSDKSGLVDEMVERFTATTPTPDASGNFTITADSVRTLEDTNDVLGVEYNPGTQDAAITVASVSGNTVTLLAEEPDGAGGFQAKTTQLNGDVTITVAG